jgi:hypothetical protein
MIKNKLLLVATIAASILLPATVPAQSFSIEIGDRPHYRHGPRYWAGDYEMIWVPGHRSGRNWVHGRYIRGENRRHRSDRHYNRYERGDDRRDDNRDYRRDDRY